MLARECCDSTPETHTERIPCPTALCAPDHMSVCMCLDRRTPQDATRAEPALIKGDQRVVVVMVDGLGPDYLEQSPMPVFKDLMAKGFSKTVAGVMPSVTNVNNASIATGCSVHTEIG